MWVTGIVVRTAEFVGWTTENGWINMIVVTLNNILDTLPTFVHSCWLSYSYGVKCVDCCDNYKLYKLHIVAWTTIFVWTAHYCRDCCVYYRYLMCEPRRVLHTFKCLYAVWYLRHSNTHAQWSVRTVAAKKKWAIEWELDGKVARNVRNRMPQEDAHYAQRSNI